MATTTDIANQKVTYATTDKATLEAIDRAFEEALPRVRAGLGGSRPMFIGGEERRSAEEFEDRSPIDTELVLARFPLGRARDAADAVGAAVAAFPGWSRTPYEERIAILRRAAENFRARKYDISALLTIEAGKTRAEALGEVEEAADLIDAYCDQLAEARGFERDMAALDPRERNRDVMRPFGAWAIVAPFNFPVALATGMTAGVLVAGNTGVLKPASDTPLAGLEVYRCFADAGLPAGVLNFVTGRGGEVGDALTGDPRLGGIIFTGSKEVGTRLFREVADGPYARPCITEMGGKNPAIVTAKADLGKAVEGVARSAFGFGGQKCSACSRVYVERPVYDDFIAALVERTRQLRIGDPAERDVYVGPVINESARRRFAEAAERARREGKVRVGGEVLQGGEQARGYFVAPTIVDGLPLDHDFFKEELFLPFLAVAPVDSLDEALREANNTEYGLTAGIFSEDPAEIDRFFDGIEAGVVYANRSGGATTGAWPGCQSFTGWKASGSSGKGGLGPYYVQQFLREQSRTIVVDDDPHEREVAEESGE
ncbi:MAG: Delta-1-pyrroline-5-carboxylate dehydrogenase [uncultured Thermomicrobiales bacterium]|uniref:L-glutamate gamma-semialdehyde dehydrogenase n=1 Tax=uncultured Thermomicrobiales bacterium TaxID=1645740 RepID=A0A6J4VQK6_9BACT|nr:MAG: Delta-1-pyrroline-5-carboxylate dehydrogenase [uncultured Thermomicrobiales bacterium]